MHLFQLHMSATICTISQVATRTLSHGLRTKMQIAPMKMYTKMLLLSLSFGGKAFGFDAGIRDHVKRPSVWKKLPIPTQIISVANPSVAFWMIRGSTLRSRPVKSVARMLPKISKTLGVNDLEHMAHFRSV